MAGDFLVFLCRTHPHSKLLTGSLDVKMERINTIEIHFKCFKIAGPQGECRFLALAGVKL